MAKLSTKDVHALHFLEKYRELMLDEAGQYFGSVSARAAIDRKQIEKLAALGACRVDPIGESTFAVFLGKPA